MISKERLKELRKLYEDTADERIDEDYSQTLFANILPLLDTVKELHEELVDAKEEEDQAKWRTFFLEMLLKDIGTYLDTGTPETSIHQGSGFHKQIKEALKND